jgi:hypothetical protein
MEDPTATKTFLAETYIQDFKKLLAAETKDVDYPKLFIVDTDGKIRNFTEHLKTWSDKKITICNIEKPISEKSVLGETVNIRFQINYNNKLISARAHFRFIVDVNKISINSVSVIAAQKITF